MSIDRVSEAFAFVLENGEFSETILFAEPRLEELKPDEVRAADAILKHVETCYVALLRQCRQTFLDLARSTKLDENRSQLEQNDSSAKTIWNRGMTQVPLHIGSSWDAWVSFGLFAEPAFGQAIRLSADITTRRRCFSVLQDVLVARQVPLSAVGNAHRLGRLELKQGQLFVDLAGTLAKEAIPVAAALYAKLTEQKD